MRLARFAITLACLGAALAWLGSRSLAAETQSKNEQLLAVFDSAVLLVKQHLVYRGFDQKKWLALASQQRAFLSKKPASVSEDHLEAALNTLMLKTGSFRPRFFTEDSQPYWILSSIFHQDIDADPLQHMGVFFERHGSRWFAKDVLEGSPAFQAGILRGDEMISVDGAPFKPVAPFRNWKSSQSDLLSVRIRRSLGVEPTEIKLKPALESLQRSMLSATNASLKIWAEQGSTLAYLHLWGMGHQAFLETLQNHLLRIKKEKVDGLILDLRGGFGSTDYAAYLAPFFETDKASPNRLFFDKPMVALVNQDTSSGKEWIAYHLQMQRRAFIIGGVTAGSFAPAKLFVSPSFRYVILLPGADLEEYDSSRINTGLTPDLIVPEPFDYAAGTDPALKTGVERLLRNLRHN